MSAKTTKQSPGGVRVTKPTITTGASTSRTTLTVASRTAEPMVVDEDAATSSSEDDVPAAKNVRVAVPITRTTPSIKTKPAPVVVTSSDDDDDEDDDDKSSVAPPVAIKRKLVLPSAPPLSSDGEQEDGEETESSDERWQSPPKPIPVSQETVSKKTTTSVTKPKSSVSTVAVLANRVVEPSKSVAVPKKEKLPLVKTKARQAAATTTTTIAASRTTTAAAAAFPTVLTKPTIKKGVTASRVAPWHVHIDQHSGHHGIFGQTEMCQILSEKLATIAASQSCDASKIATLMFLGPSGTGKSRMARWLVQKLKLQNTIHAIELHGNTLTDPHASARLLFGSDSVLSKQLLASVQAEETEMSLSRPKSATENKDTLSLESLYARVKRVLILDNFEQVHPDVRNNCSALFERMMVTINNRLVPVPNLLIICIGTGSASLPLSTFTSDWKLLPSVIRRLDSNVVPFPAFPLEKGHAVLNQVFLRSFVDGVIPKPLQALAKELVQSYQPELGLTSAVQTWNNKHNLYVSHPTLFHTFQQQQLARQKVAAALPLVATDNDVDPDSTDTESEKENDADDDANTTVSPGISSSTTATGRRKKKRLAEATAESVRPATLSEKQTLEEAMTAAADGTFGSTLVSFKPKCLTILNDATVKQLLLQKPYRFKSWIVRDKLKELTVALAVRHKQAYFPPLGTYEAAGMTVDKNDHDLIKSAADFPKATEPAETADFDRLRIALQSLPSEIVDLKSQGAKMSALFRNDAVKTELSKGLYPKKNLQEMILTQFGRAWKLPTTQSRKGVQKWVIKTDDLRRWGFRADLNHKKHVIRPLEWFPAQTPIDVGLQPAKKLSLVVEPAKLADVKGTDMKHTSVPDTKSTTHVASKAAECDARVLEPLKSAPTDVTHPLNDYLNSADIVRGVDLYDAVSTINQGFRQFCKKRKIKIGNLDLSNCRGVFEMNKLRTVSDTRPDLSATTKLRAATWLLGCCTKANEAAARLVASKQPVGNATVNGPALVATASIISAPVITSLASSSTPEVAMSDVRVATPSSDQLLHELRSLVEKHAAEWTAQRAAESKKAVTVGNVTSEKVDAEDEPDPRLPVLLHDDVRSLLHRHDFSPKRVGEMLNEVFADREFRSHWTNLWKAAKLECSGRGRTAFLVVSDRTPIVKSLSVPDTNVEVNATSVVVDVTKKVTTGTTADEKTLPPTAPTKRTAKRPAATSTELPLQKRVKIATPVTSTSAAIAVTPNSAAAAAGTTPIATNSGNSAALAPLVSVSVVPTSLSTSIDSQVDTEPLESPQFTPPRDSRLSISVQSMVPPPPPSVITSSHPTM